MSEANSASKPFREALMRIWVAGWLTGSKNPSNTQSADTLVAELTRQFPTESALADLQLAIEQALNGPALDHAKEQ